VERPQNLERGQPIARVIHIYTIQSM
jgi:hypothetical protein